MIIILAESAADRFGSQSILRTVLKIFLYLCSFLFALLCWNQALEPWLVVVGKIKLNNLRGILSFPLSVVFPFRLLLLKPFFPVLILGFINHFQLLFVLLLFKFRVFLIYIYTLTFSGELFDHLFQLEPFVSELLLHHRSSIFVFRNLFLVTQQFPDWFPGFRFGFLHNPVLLLLYLLQHLLKVTL